MPDSELKFAGTAAALMLSFLVNLTPLAAADFPQAEIANGQITAKIYLPDARNGYYRSTRFDWSGAVYSLRFFCSVALREQSWDERLPPIRHHYAG